MADLNIMYFISPHEDFISLWYKNIDVPIEEDVAKAWRPEGGRMAIGVEPAVVLDYYPLAESESVFGFRGRDPSAVGAPVRAPDL